MAPAARTAAAFPRFCRRGRSTTIAYPDYSRV